MLVSPPKFIMSRKAAFVFAWQLFWLATGTSRVGVIVQDDHIELVGSGLIKERS